MPLHIVISHDPLLLLERAADGFLERRRGDPSDPFPSPRYLLALRQGGLRDDLLRLAARRGCPGWFDPPLCVFGELSAWLGGTARTPLTGEERRVLLMRVLHEVGGRILLPPRRPDACLDALDALFGELCAEGIGAESFARALAAGEGDRDDFERERDAELASVFSAYTAAMDEVGRRDGRDSIVDAARALTTYPDVLPARLGGRRELRLVGLQDLRGGWRTLLTALAASPALDRVVVYTSVELELRGVRATVEELRTEGTLPARLFANAAAGDRLPRMVHGMEAPDAAREVDEVARRIRTLCDGGVAPHRIAVVARESRPHVDLAASALTRLGVPVTVRRRVTLTEIPAVRALLTLLDAAAEGWTRHALVEVAEQPYLDAALDVQVVNIIGYRRQVHGLPAWRAAVDALHEEARRRERGDEPDGDGWERRTHLPAVARITAARETLARLAARAAELGAERTLGEWLEWLRGVVEGDSWGIERQLRVPPIPGRYDVLRTDIAGWERMRCVVDAWRAALEQFGQEGAGGLLDAGRFAARLRRMLDGDVAIWSRSGHGVQLLEAPGAAYRCFDHLFVVGLEGGTFPMRAPHSPLLGEWERERLVAAGLPLDPSATWDERERELFRVLCAGAREGLTLTWSSVDMSGREVVRSTFVDEVEEVATLERAEIPLSRVLVAGTPLCPTDGVAEHARRMAAIERSRARGEPSPWNGEIEDPELRGWIAREFGEGRVWSPTQLEHYARCPWAYFAGRLLRVEANGEPDDGIEPSVRGRILHRVLQRFYDLAVREGGGAPVLLREEDAPKAGRDLMRELDNTLGEMEVAGTWLGAPVLRAALRDELARALLRYVEFEIEHARLMHSARSRTKIRILRTGVVAHELRFDDVTLDAGGVQVRFRGSIDRVERGMDDRIDGADGYVAAVDYKTSTNAIPGRGKPEAWLDGVVLQAPIYARVLEELYPGATVSRMEYRSIRGREVKHDLQLHQVSKLPAVEESVEDNERMVAAMEAIAGHVAGVRAGSFPARPAPSCGCPSYCPAIDSCRVAGGPQRKEW